MKQERRRWRSKLKNKSGVTLIELVVAFALLGLFIAVSCQVISNSLNVYYHIKALTYGQQVSDTLLEKISGEIEGAHPSILGVDEDKTLKIYENGAVIELYDRTQSHICMTSSHSYDKIHNLDRSIEKESDQENLFVIHYYAVNRYEAVNWTFDKNFYMGYEIEKLTFSQADPEGIEYPKNIIKIDLALTSKKYGSYHSTRYVECYNFVSDSDFDKIYDDSSPESPEVTPDTTPEVTPDTTPEISPEVTSTPEPWNEKFSDSTEDENDLVQAIHKYFADEYVKMTVKDESSGDYNSTGTIYFWYGSIEGQGYVAVYHPEVVMKDTDLKSLADMWAGADANIIDITGTVSDGKWLLGALGNDFSERYKDVLLYFDTERKKLMAVKYSNIEGNEEQWGYFNDYTAEDVSRIIGSS